METKMPWPVPGRQRDGGWFVRRQKAVPFIKLPDKNPVQPQVGVQDESSRGIRLNHVRVRSVVSAEGETARWRMGGLFRSDRAVILLDIRGGAQSALLQNRE